jgi:hypothetical protein
MRILAMAEKKRIHYNTTIDAELLKQLKFLSVEENKRHNELLEEAIRDLLIKRGKKIK